MKLTEAQIATLGILDRYRDGIDVPTSTILDFGGGVSSLAALERRSLVAGVVAARSKFWRITPAGRAALQEREDE